MSANNTKRINIKISMVEYEKVVRLANKKAVTLTAVIRKAINDLPEA